MFSLIICTLTICAPAPFTKSHEQGFDYSRKNLCGKWELSWNAATSIVTFDPSGKYRETFIVQHHNFDGSVSESRSEYEGTWNVTNNYLTIAVKFYPTNPDYDIQPICYSFELDRKGYGKCSLTETRIRFIKRLAK